MRFSRFGKALVMAVLAAIGRVEGARGAGAAEATMPPLYKDPSLPVETRVKDLVSRLTVEEKVRMLGGTGFTTQAIPRLDVPAFVMSDGPVGLRNAGATTAYPAGIGLAASFNVENAKAIGTALGRDARSRGVHILLGPAMNLYRSPLSGRNFEYLGEDPVLAGTLAAGYVEALQAEHVAGTIKHFAGNEQEYDRHHLDTVADERTLRELYLRPFQICVEQGHPWCVMTSYNPLNGVHASENHWLITEVLKGEWGFPGLVMSDWDSCYNTLGMANGGLDLEMPKAVFYAPEKVKPLLEGGKIEQGVIDDKVRRMLTVAFSMGWFDRAQQDATIQADDPQNNTTALAGALESVTLLKNEHGFLPLDRSKIRSIVLVGPTADPAVVSGGGSASLTAFHPVSIVEGVKALANEKMKVTRIAWTSPGPGKKKPVRALSDDDVAAIKGADVVLVCVGFNDKTGAKAGYEGEGSDRAYALPAEQVEMLHRVLSLNAYTAVILTAGGAVDTAGWLEKTPVLLDTYYPGSNGGTAVAQTLFGNNNPSGKLPFTWEQSLADYPATANYPSQETGRVNEYKETLFTGYRRKDLKEKPPLFAFGGGLSYTTFEVGTASEPVVGAEGVTVTVPVKNTGSRPGAQVVQLYVAAPGPGDVARPAFELKAYAKVSVGPGETKVATLHVPLSLLAYWDAVGKGWVLAKGTYTAYAGTSSVELGRAVTFVVR